MTTLCVCARYVQIKSAHDGSALREAQRRAMSGGQMYDVLIALAARKAEASTIITWNVRHYEAFAPSIAVQAPP